MRSSTADFAAAGAVLATVAAFQAQAGDLEGISLYFPEMLLIFLTLGACVLLVQGLVKRRRESGAQEGEPVAVRRVWLIAVGSILYVAAIPVLGFYPGSVIFLFTMAMLLGETAGHMKKSLLAATVFTVVLAAAVWGGFSLLLSVPTPESILFVAE